jgi:pyruvate kinase
MKRSRRTKIVATLGPASDSPEMIGRLHEAGADVFRLNMSHLPRERLREKVDVIRGVEAKAKRPIAILADLQGPKLRVGAFHGDGTHLWKGSASPSTPTRVRATATGFTYPIPRSCPPWSRATPC